MGFFVIKKYFLSFVFAVCTALTVFSADCEKKERIEATVQPPYSKRVLFSLPTGSITVSFFSIEDEENPRFMAASSYVEQNNALKLERKTYCAKFTDGEQAYVASHVSLTPYSTPEFGEHGQPIKYRRTDATTLHISHPLAKTFQLNKDHCQAAYHAQTLEAYFADMDISMKKSTDIDSFLENGCRAETEPQILGKVIFLSDILSIAYFDGTYVRKEHVLCRPFMILERENSRRKCHEEIHLYPAIIGEKKYVFYANIEVAYRLQGFEKTTETTDDPMVTREVSTPVYLAEIPFMFRGKPIPFPAEATHVINKKQTVNTITESGLLCLNHTRKLGSSCKHVVQLCELVLETTTGVRIMPDDYQDSYTETSRIFTIKGDKLTSDTCGKWRYAGDFSSIPAIPAISAMTNGFVIPQNVVKKISENTVQNT